MPKAQVVNYAAQLCKVTTAILDYLTYNKFPKTWPETLKDFELVIESWVLSFTFRTVLVNHILVRYSEFKIPSFIQIDYILRLIKRKSDLHISF